MIHTEKQPQANLCEDNFRELDFTFKKVNLGPEHLMYARAKDFGLPHVPVIKVGEFCKIKSIDPIWFNKYTRLCGMQAWNCKQPKIQSSSSSISVKLLSAAPLHVYKHICIPKRSDR